MSPRSKKKRDNMIRIKKLYLGILIFFALIGISSWGEYLYTYKISSNANQNLYFEGYKEGSQTEYLRMNGYNDGFNNDERLITVQSAYDTEVESYRINVKHLLDLEEKNDLGFKDGYMNMYIHNFIMGVYSKNEGIDHRESYIQDVETN